LERMAPDRWQLEFGLSLTIKSGHAFALFASGGVEATVNVTVEWDRSKT
jgi:hypothetical protein